MSKIPSKLLRKLNQPLDALRVVFTPVRTSHPDPAHDIFDKANQRALAKAKYEQEKENDSSENGRLDIPTEQTSNRAKTRGRRFTANTPRQLEQLKNALLGPEVINTRLMDDVLTYLAPTLEQYKGCTIIDLFPGSCVWSRKVHEFLKPKCHVLLEPAAQYQKHVDELVNSPNSTYKHVALHGALNQAFAATFKHVFSNKGPLPRPPLALEDPASIETDSSLLVIGSMNRGGEVSFHGKSYRGSISSLYHLCWGAIVNEYMHRWGRVRMLLWTPEKDRATLLPEWCLYRNTTEATIGIAMHIENVVSVEQVTSKRYINKWSMRSRWSGLTATSEKMVQDRMNRNGMRVPDGRHVFHYLSQNYDPSITPKAVDESPYKVRYKTREQVEAALDDLWHHWKTRGSLDYPARNLQLERWRYMRARPDEVYQNFEFPGLADAMLENPCKSTKFASHSKIIAQGEMRDGILALPEADLVGNRQRQSIRKELCGTDLKIALLADCVLRGINLETHCKILEEQGVDVADLSKRVMEFGDAVIKRIEHRRDVYEAEVGRLVDDWTSLFAPSPLLMVDRRQFQPLQASPLDFWPRGNLSLLDFVPTNIDLAIPGLAGQRNAATVCRNIIGILYAFKSQPVVAVLERLAPNASVDLIHLTPSITDPRKGGRLNPKHLKVRQMTCEMFHGLMKAWFDWPFKPEGWELELGMMERESRGRLNSMSLMSDESDEYSMV